ncbi:unnamed protein product [Orchesella dallaii]|uniref:Odorant receptor n=1 Tax=Orchesella dallaii TaxID=48710 RepID=A0ABP1RVP7_9HEXA
MITERIETAIGRRMGSSVKRTFCYICYWDTETSHFILGGNYVHFNFCLAFILGIFAVILNTWVVFIAISGSSFEIEEEGKINSNKNSYDANIFTICTGFCASIVLFAISLIILRLKEKRGQVVQSLNATLDFDKMMKTQFSNVLTASHFQTKDHKIFELLIDLLCRVSLLFPWLGSATIFHPAHPLNKILKFYLEIDVSISFFTVFITLILFYGILVFANSVVTIIAVILISVYSIRLWVRAMMPVEMNGDKYFRTRQLQNVTEEWVVTFYKAVQLQCNIVNDVIASFKIAFHSGALLIILSIMGFMWVQYSNRFLESIRGMGLGILTILGIITGILITHNESTQFLLTIQISEEFKNNLLKFSTPTSYLGKTAKSFRPLSLQATYPFFTVEKRTFLIFCNAVVNLVVTLVVTF